MLQDLLLKTKLHIPPKRSELVSRPRLIERLNVGLHRTRGGFSPALTLISAPAGFGKTTLLSEWAADCECPVVWLSLDKDDNDPARFLAYLVAALQRVRADMGEAALTALKSPQPPPIEPLLTDLINRITELSEPFALVLDDLHVIAASQVHDVLNFLLDHLPPPMHLILSSRADPPWPLARRRARREIIELRADDLRFNTQEVATFLQEVMGLDLLPEDVAALEERTEGWIAGLQMAALSMRGRQDMSGFITALNGTHRFILDYLVEEVLDQQPLDIQDFLLKTSILDRMTALLSNAVTGRDDSQAVLTQLERANLFIVPLDDERRWYRYHHLFADLLRRQLEQTKPKQVSALHLGASRWYEQNGLYADAVSHALAAGDVERVAHLVEGKTLAIVEHEELTSLVRQLDNLPDEVVRSRPWLCVACAWVLSYAGHVDRIEPLLQVAEEGLDQVEDRTEARSILGRIIHLRSYIADLRGDSPRSSILGREALKHIPHDDLSLRAYTLSQLGVTLRKLGDLSGAARAFAEAVALSQAAGDSHGRVMVLCRMATLQIWQGQLNRAAMTCQEALSLTREYARREGRQLPTAGYAHIQMSRVLSERNDLAAAHWHARRGIELSQRWGQADILEFGYLHLARILYRQQALESLLEVTREINQIISMLPTWFTPTVTEVEVMYRLVSGDAEGAFQFAQEQGVGTFESLSPDRYYPFFTFVRLLTIQGKDDPSRLDQALELVARLLSTAERTGATGYVIESLVLQAMALQAKGERDQALIALRRALSLAEPECYVRTFIDEGAPMGELLEETAVQGVAPQYVSKLLSALETTFPHSRTPTLVDLLSERELEVLRLLATRLPTTEIANELSITVSTLRTHTKNLYGKLDVHSRREAVARAQELGLF